MNVVGITIIGGGNRDDRLQGRGLQGGYLERIEAAPGFSHHPDLAVTPGLFGDPGNNLQRVAEFGFTKVFIVQNAFGFTGTTDIDTQACITVAREVAVHRFIAVSGQVALAIGDVFQNGRNRLVFCVFGHPDARGKTGAVFQRDTGFLDIAD